jgi:microcystin-dependent protein
VGCIVAFAGDSAGLAGWELCQGQSVSKGDFLDLFAVLGTTWGGDGNPHFNLPDLRGRFALCGGSGGSWSDLNAPTSVHPLSTRKPGEAGARRSIGLLLKRCLNITTRFTPSTLGISPSRIQALRHSKRVHITTFPVKISSDTGGTTSAPPQLGVSLRKMGYD